MTIEDIVKEIDERLSEPTDYSDEWDRGYDTALQSLRSWITGDYGNVN